MLSRLLYLNPDCLELVLVENVKVTNQFFWIGYWASPESLESYLETDQFRSLVGAVEVLGFLESLRTGEMRSIKTKFSF